jgi:hypothetical protein
MMKNESQPLRSTIIFGLLCCLFFIPLALGLSHFVYWPKNLIIPVWFYVALYSSFLTHWSMKSNKSIIYPLLLILLALPWMDSITLFMVLIFGSLSWIRSGICFPNNRGKKVLIEIFLCLVAGGLFISLKPNTLLTWALAVWVFFLVQALYFVFHTTNDDVTESIKGDPFENAREQAEIILTKLT